MYINILVEIVFLLLFPILAIITVIHILYNIKKLDKNINKFHNKKYCYNDNKNKEEITEEDWEKVGEDFQRIGEDLHKVFEKVENLFRSNNEQ